MPEQNLDFNPIVTETATVPYGFRDIVLDRQMRWKTLKRNSLKEFSQAADIPEAISKNLLGLVIDNLPSYIPEELKTKLRDTHPNPIIAVGVLADKRNFYDEEQDMLPDFIIPEDIEGGKNQQAYERGITLLNEVATDALAKDVLSQLGSKHKWFKPVASVLENIIPSNYKSELKKAEKIFGGREKFNTFKQSLNLAMLSGQNDFVNEQLKKLGYDSLDQFAVEMGEQSAVLTDFSEKISTPRIMNSLAGGFVSPAFPGVLNFPLTHTLIASYSTATAVDLGIQQLANRMNPDFAVVNWLLVAFNSYLALRLGSGIPYVVIHETCHYLGWETSHFGLKTIEYSERKEED